MSQAANISPDTGPADFRRYETPSRLRVRFGISTTLLGLFVFLVGAKPGWFGWDRSPVVGFVQIAVFLVGLAIICLGGYSGLLALWKGQQRSILADIGTRLVSTGYVVAVFAGMADVFGMTVQQTPAKVPFFGPWQAAGMQTGMLIIAIGVLMTSGDFGCAIAPLIGYTLLGSISLSQQYLISAGLLITGGIVILAVYLDIVRRPQR